MTPLAPEVINQLRAIAPLDTDPASCAAYGTDNSKLFAQPQAVAFAHSHAQVAALVQVCHAQRIPLTVRGRGTNTTGASVPLHGGLVLSLERMNQILRIEPGNRLLVAQAGALNGEVQAAAAAHQLFWPPDPTSAGFSTVGGNLACGAGGPRAVKYGTARDAVLGLKAVSGTGATLITGAFTTKSVVGYDLTRLLIGSEGTLAIITEATLKLTATPPLRQLLRACYRSVSHAAAAVARIMAQPHLPSACEFLDGLAIQLAEGYQPTGIPPGTGALLLLEADGDAHTLPAAVAALHAAALGEGLVDCRAAHSPEEAASLWACRKALSPALRQLAPKKVNEDVAVPVTRLPELVAAVQGLAQTHQLQIVCFGHAGNGNLHVNLLANPDNPDELRRIDACLHALFRIVLDLQGTLSGEHGIGAVKRAYVGWEVPPPTLALMQAIKTQFDPLGILNPGKALPDLAAI